MGHYKWWGMRVLRCEMVGKMALWVVRESCFQCNLGDEVLTYHSQVVFQNCVVQGGPVGLVRQPGLRSIIKKQLDLYSGFC